MKTPLFYVRAHSEFRATFARFVVPAPDEAEAMRTVLSDRLWDAKGWSVDIVEQIDVLNGQEVF